MSKAKPTFEEALAGLEKSAADLAKPDSTLDETVSNFEKGIRYYNMCTEILSEAKQKVITYQKRGDSDAKS